MVMAKTLPPRPVASFALTSQVDPAIARKKAAAAIARSLNRQINTAWMLLRTANRFPTYDGSHERFVKSSARVLGHAESQMWKVELEPGDLVGLASNIERLWFAIDALS
jgi:hypothetical protein